MINDPFDAGLYQAAEQAMQKSYSPYSKFKVGAALRTESGAVFSGCNVENAAYPSSLCAETTAVGTMAASGHRKIKAIAVCSSGDEICPPCGNCRQVISEFADAETPVYLFVPGKKQQKTTLGALLHLSFNKASMEKLGSPDNGSSKAEGRNKAEFVEEGFSDISKKYDLFNDVITFGMHRRWKRTVALEALAHKPKRVLDACCGTGDIALELEKVSKSIGLETEIIGLDFSKPMLSIANQKKVKDSDVSFMHGNIMLTQFPDGFFDAVTIGFGLRNTEDVNHCLVELHRILSPKGKLVILDMGKPRNFLFKMIFKLYFFYIVPIIGVLLASKKEMFSYFPQSTLNYPAPEKLKKMLLDSGYSSASYKNFMLGSVCIHTANRNSL